MQQEVDNSANRKEIYLFPVPNCIPTDLRDRKQWVLWTAAYRDSKLTKIPLNPRVSRPVNASATNRSTWGSFDDLFRQRPHWNTKPNGIGFVFSTHDPYCGIDLDKCRDADTGIIEPWAQEIIDELDSFTEISPSGTGVHIIIRGKLPRGRNRTGRIEMYDTGRYFAMTGRVVDGRSEIRNRQAELDALHARVFPPKEHQEPANSSGSVPADDNVIIERALKAKNGAKFQPLWAGDTSVHAGDDSAADQALCNMLAFWCGPDPHRIDGIFRLSGLMREKWERTDYRQRTIAAAIEGRTEFYKWKGKAKKAKPKSSPFDPSLPRINAGSQHLPSVTTEAWSAIEKANDPPFLFRHGGAPSRIDYDDHGAPHVRAMDDYGLRHAMARSANWIKETSEGDVPAIPPMTVVRDLLATPLNEIPLPILSRIVEAPVFAPDGSLVTKPGYHPAGKVFLATAAGFAISNVPEKPTSKELVAAITFILSEMLVDFPFIGPAERAHALAAMILPFVRDMITGPTPLHLFEAPTPGTGKTLLVEMITYPATGRALSAMTEGKDDDEWRKRIFAKLRTGPAAVLIDNIRRRLDASALASAITAYPAWEDRILGQSEIARAPVRCVWLATGNNPGVSGEMARRIIRIRLDSKNDRPWLREPRQFRHADIRTWVAENRAKIVSALLTIVRYWICQGRPQGEKSLGMFESWSKTMGGILETAGVGGFLENLNDFYDQADAETNEWRDFISAWWHRYGGKEALVKDLWEICIGVEIFNLGAGNEQRQRTRLGQLIGRQRDRVYTVRTDDESEIQVRIERGPKFRGAVRWKLRQMTTSGDVSA